MECYVLDTNVASVANRQTPHASGECVSACSNMIEHVTKNGVLLIDDRWRILKEYQNNLFPPGPKGMGHAFLKWVLENRSNSKRCKQITIHERDGKTDDFVEFPADSALAGFDPSDRKFVAVALASRENPEILNAVDKHWWNYRKQLEKNGLRIKFLCPSQFSP